MLASLLLMTAASLASAANPDDTLFAFEKALSNLRPAPACPDQRFDLDHLRRCGLRTDMLLRLDATLGVLIQQQRDRIESLNWWAAQFWCCWMTEAERSEPYRSLAGALALGAGRRLRPLLLTKTKARRRCPDEVAFVNWIVSELGDRLGLSPTTSLVLVALHVIFGDGPVTSSSVMKTDDQGAGLVVDLQQLIASVDEKELPSGVAGPDDLHLPLHFEVLIHWRAMRLGYDVVRELGEAANGQLFVAELEPIMFLVAVLYQIPLHPDRTNLFAASLTKIVELPIVRHSQAESALALAYMMYVNYATTLEIGKEAFTGPNCYKVLDEKFDLGEFKKHTYSEEFIAQIQGLIDSSIGGLRSFSESFSPKRRRPHWSLGKKSFGSSSSSSLSSESSPGSSRCSPRSLFGSPSSSSSGLTKILGRLGFEVKRRPLTLYECVETLKGCFEPRPNLSSISIA